MKLVIQAATVIALTLLLSAFATAKGQVTLNMTGAEEIVVVNEKGEKEKKYIPPKSVTPGDIILYTIHYKNQGGAPADAVVITNPIPEHMEYVDETGLNPDTAVSFSIDGGVSYDRPENLYITKDDGKKRPAVPADYTHIKWQLKTTLNPNGEGTVGYRAKLE